MKLVLLLLCCILVGVQSYTFVQICDLYGNQIKPVARCPQGSYEYQHACVNPCPGDFNRVGLCTCQKGASELNCTKYGNARMVDGRGCLNGEEYYAGTCVSKCDHGMTRSGGCTCSNKTAVSSCEKYGPLKLNGIQIAPGCDADEDLFDGKCIKPACPKGWTRVSECGCFYIPESDRKQTYLAPFDSATFSQAPKKKPSSL